jgi:predicted dinucleotide-binding enzyme
MNITILGAGNMGAALTKQLSLSGHSVRVVSRDTNKARDLASRYRGVVTAAAADGIADSDAVIVATGYEDAVSALHSLGSLAGTVVVDVTNPLTKDFSGLSVGHDTSAAEEIAKAVPGADVVKAFNTLFAQVLDDGPSFPNSQTAPAFFASDSERAKDVARKLIESIGFKAIDAGGLKNARYLEPLAGLNIYFGYGAGRGTAIAPTWISKPQSAR